jgi:transcriptional regulator GlxA family with amidase domain
LKMRENTIAVITFDGISPFHLSVPCATFGEDRTGVSLPKFELLVCSVEKGTLQTSAGFSIETRYGLKDLARAAIVIVPSWRDTAEPPPKVLLDALRKAHKRGALIVGLCLGSFVLAAAGLLDGREATTHWFWADELARRYPLINVKPDVLYVDVGDIITSAGTAAAIDCCLHIMLHDGWSCRRTARAGKLNIYSSRCVMFLRLTILRKCWIGQDEIWTSRTVWIPFLNVH